MIEPFGMPRVPVSEDRHHMVYPALLFATTLTVSLMLPSSTNAQAGAASPPAAAVVRDPIQGAWNADELDRTVGVWREECADASTADLNARFNLFRSERNAALAHGQGRLKASDRQRLSGLSNDLERTAPMSFEAHMARYYVEFPAPEAFVALGLAAQLDAARAELIGPLLADAARRNDLPALKQRAVALKSRGGIQPGFMQAADDLLLSVETKAVLFVAGEMDAYPLWIRQHAEGQRKDLLIVDVRLLDDAAYRRTVWTSGGAKGAIPATGESFLSRFVASNSTRPVYLALSLGAERLAPFKQNTYSTGLAVKYSTVPVDNLPLLEERWRRFSKPTAAGPLSRNYLLPASILLQHYRSIGNEAKGAEMEHELRRFATAIKSTSVLYTLGILEH